MNYQITWPVVHRVVMITQVGSVSARDVEMAAQKLYDAIESEPIGPIHVLIDTREGHMSDKLWNYAQLKIKRHVRGGFIIMIGDSRLTGLLIAIFSKALNLHIHYQATPNAALKFLQERDASLVEDFV